MDQLRGLALDRLNQIRVAMPEDVHCNPADEIEILSPLEVVHLRLHALAQSRAVDAYRSASNNVQRPASVLLSA